jgi:hypothetical protein
VAAVLRSVGFAPHLTTDKTAKGIARLLRDLPAYVRGYCTSGTSAELCVGGSNDERVAVRMT